MTMPPNESGDPKGPWLYSGANPAPATPAYVPPAMTGATPPAERPRAATPAAPAGSAAPPPPPPRPAPAPAPARPVDKKQDPSLAGIIDTIEAIIIALILALTFRAFIVEAFVIPTGSMAPTLLGAHFKVTCPKCGYEFDRNADLTYQYRGGPNPAIVEAGARAELTSNAVVPADQDRGPHIHGPPICPNCGYALDFSEMPQSLGTYPVERDDRPGRAFVGVKNVPFAWANNGDRILVLKYLYALLPPQRWDVIVFKEPLKAQDNYIKRLIGLPGETIEIINGDIYVAPRAAGHSPTDRVIARKPTAVQESVWQLVYDNDFYPVDEGKPRTSPPGMPNVWRNPWYGETQGWTLGGPVLTFDPSKAGGAKPGSLRFQPREPYGLNTLGYNNDVMDLLGGNTETISRVGDLRVETTWSPADENPSIQLTAGLPANCLRVRWSAGGIELSRLNQGSGDFDPLTPRILKTPSAPAQGKAYHVALENVDRTARLFIDGDLVAELEMPWTAADARRQAVADRGLPPDQSAQVIRVEVSGAATLSHLKVFRDLYYTQSSHDYPNTANTDRPLTLGEDEFFPLGDNSRESSDGRYWNDVYPALDDLGTRRGIVPRRYLLGKAFFVYWPAGFRATNNTNVPFFSSLPLVPDAGDMRLIR